MKVLLVNGHDFENKGAFNNKLNIYEYDVVRKIISEIFINEQSKGLDLIIKSRNEYKNLPTEINSLNCDLVIELHLNAFNEKVQGTEVLYWNNSTLGEKYAKIFQRSFIKYLKYNNRGIKPIFSGDRGAHILRGTVAPTLILEPFFIDSINGKLKLNYNILATTRAILETLYMIVGELKCI